MNQINLPRYGETDLFCNVQHFSVRRHVIRVNILSDFTGFIVDQLLDEFPDILIARLLRRRRRRRGKVGFILKAAKLDERIGDAFFRVFLRCNDE